MKKSYKPRQHSKYFVPTKDLDEQSAGNLPVERDARIRIFIAENDFFTRCGLRYLLSEVAHFEVVGEAAEGEAAFAMIAELKPQVAILKSNLPGLDGVALSRKISQRVPETNVMVLTSSIADCDIRAAFEAGARGYCLGGISPQRLITAIQSVSDGAGWIDPGVSKQFLREGIRYSEQSGQAQMLLTEREKEVLRLIAQGLTNHEIARCLVLSPETIKTHVKHIMGKLAVNDRTLAVVTAIRKGIEV